MKSSFRSLLLASALIAFATPALAQDTAIEAARDAGQIGEQADGYLGFVGGAAPNADLKARVDQVNILRRKLYTEKAQERGVTVDNMAAATACELFRARIGPNEAYRDETGAWRTREGDAEVPLPSFCRT